MKKVLFISLCAFKYEVYGGVVAKSKYLHDYLTSCDIKLFTIDTYWERKSERLLFLKRILRNSILLVKLFVMGIWADEIIIAQNKYNVFAFYRAIGLSHKITFFVAGGVFHELLKSGQVDYKNFCNMKKIFVESRTMEKVIIECGMKNVERLANFKPLPKIELMNNIKTSEELAIFYLGKVTLNKGIGLLIEVVNSLAQDGLKITLDIYGPIDEDEDEIIRNMINKSPHVKYKGCINLIGSIDEYGKLLKYDAFVFPTYWKGEGFPGVIIDSFALGKPVIASDWNFNKEVVEHGFNGLLFESKNSNALKVSLEYIYKHREELIVMGRNAYLSSQKYDSTCVLSVLGLDRKN